MNAAVPGALGRQRRQSLHHLGWTLVMSKRVVRSIFSEHIPPLPPAKGRCSTGKATKPGPAQRLCPGPLHPRRSESSVPQPSAPHHHGDEGGVQPEGRQYSVLLFTYSYSPSFSCSFTLSLLSHSCFLFSLIFFSASFPPLSSPCQLPLISVHFCVFPLHLFHNPSLLMCHRAQEH